MKQLQSAARLCFAILLLAAGCSAPAPTLSPPQTQIPTLVSPTETQTQRATPAPPTATRAQVPTEPVHTPSPTALPPSATPQPTQPPATDTPPPASNDSTFSLDIEPLAQDYTKPVFVTGAGDGTNRLFVVEQAGIISILQNGQKRAEPFLDLRDRVNSSGSERGLLSVAFHPDYKNNGLFYVNYTAQPGGDTVIARFRVSDDPNIADVNSETILLTIAQPEANHNGGMIAFGPDGYLYIGMGDGGGAGDRHGSIGYGQALNTLLGKMLRIDVNGDPYRISADNPFVGQANAEPEIWSYGLRNPWRFSFDRATDDLYIADVGQGAWEEVNFQPASSAGGENYGWRLMEGNHCYNPDENCDTGGLVKPIAQYSHDFGCSITGGYVYRGQNYPWLVGQYIFADYCTGIAWATARDANGEWNTRRVGKFDDTISSFGQDDQGELYVVGHGSGTIYKLTSVP